MRGGRVPRPPRRRGLVQLRREEGRPVPGRSHRPSAAAPSADFFFSVRDGKDPKRDLSGEHDDDNDSLHPFGFFTRTSDPPAYKFTAPDDGKYLVVVGCRESSVLHGPRTAYRLRVSPAKPDFRAVAMPYSRHYQTGSSAWQGGTQAYDVFVHRIDGYTGAIS